MAGSTARMRISSPFTSNKYKNHATCRRFFICLRANGSQSGQSSSGNRQLTGPCIVNLQGTNTSRAQLTLQRNDLRLSDYMSQIDDVLADMDLPLGGKVSKIDETHLQITIPKIQLYDFWLQPISVVEITHSPNSVEVTTTTSNCVMDASQQIKDMGLDKMYNVNVRLALKWDDVSQPTLTSTSSINVEVDLPPPFSLIPKPLVKAGGDAAMNATLAILVSSFGEKIKSDLKTWNGGKI
ncbi:hypothetical protein CEUSTIGMA_g3314.t1 [Chlamydomonas eustigma]|uniref:Uncharacterized protein n=1 Tax=Chlamydomonas eustigma TaxID=1157962 RepID=A0A250WYG3_9CHLO|nr:hypothetical protein CEUSTIGMA_g3314.t1 [Chlamydomonas eustigma]|eukprot:GAX75871.1 hypothetical protein CEUSTIGMA_g3314.t1 [Chlamydomonas eustigma]